MLKDCSIRPTAAGLEIAETNHGIPMEKLLEGTGYTREDVQRGGRASWEFCSLIARRMQDALGGPSGWDKFYTTGKMTPYGKVMRTLIGSFLSQRQAFILGVCVLGNLHHPQVKRTLRDLPDDRLRMTLEILPEYCGCSAYFYSALAVFRVFPKLYAGPNAPEAIVHAEITERRAVYEISFPKAPLTLFERMSRGLRTILGLRPTFVLLSEQHEELVKSYAELSRKEEETRQLLAHSSDCIVFCRSQTITQANRAMALALGFAAPEEITGKPLEKWMLDESRQRWRGLLAATEAPLGGVYELAFQSTSHHQHVLLEVSIVRDAAIEADTVFVVGRDITERRRLEREVLEAGNREQQRIAADLHDSLGQHLTGTAFKAQNLAEILAAERHPAAMQAREILDLLKQGARQARRLAHGLDPVASDEGGLRVALENLAHHTAELFGISCQFHCAGSFHINGAAALHLYRIAQEAVTNAFRHGRATDLRITLQRTLSGLQLQIEDNGLGFDGSADPMSEGMGLRTMRYRSHLIGAQLDVRSKPGAGTVISCTLPLVNGI